MMPRIKIVTVCLVLLCVAAVQEARSQPRPLHVAESDALSPAQQQTKFHLPEGFEIQLVVSEPQIGQPMNLNFDARGRLWITHSVEYPYPAKAEGVQPRGRFAGVGDHPPRDRLTVLGAIDPSGRGQQLRHFASGLNIPIGQTPLGDGSTALVYSIPSIFRHTDTDGDGRSDKREELYGRFGNVDTHGMSSSFTPWIDGWIYNYHNFTNHSVIRDGAGRKTEMTSGNTYRFRPDGSRFEPFTYGQVNPFGMAFDPLGNLYDADCHSKPVYLLLRGASYPHFGKQAGPLGFGPTMIDHNHQSTGICGVAYYAADHFPAAYHDNLFLCNPVTGRVHRDKLKPFGSTYRVETQPDFIRCDDSWFRPVDAMLGPDGALYIADFYNAIIGHYEVPLEHPKRDRSRGRVWRVIYRGPDGKQSPRQVTDLARLDTGQLVARLDDVNLLVRTQATNLLVDAHPKEAAAATRKALRTNSSPALAAHGLWVIERLGGLSEEEVARLAKHPHRLVRVHLNKALAERETWTPAIYKLVRQALADDDAFVRRAAADALGRHPQTANLSPLLAARSAAAREDTHLIHTVKLAVRSHFQAQPPLKELARQKFSPAETGQLIEIAAASSSDTAATFLLRQARPAALDNTTLRQIVAQIARSGKPEQLRELIAVIRTAYEQDLSKQLNLFQLLYQALAQRGQRPEQSPEARRWFAELAPRLLHQMAEAAESWTHQPLPSAADRTSPWGLRERKCTDGKTATMIDSIVQGEQRTGIYRSRPFTLPAELRFWMCGHNGRPETDPPAVNHVRLKLVKGEQIVARQTPPRSDTAREYRWDLKKYAGQQAVFEIVDASSEPAYAWLAVGRFMPATISLPEDGSSDALAEALVLVGRFELKTHLPQLLKLAAAEDQPASLRVAAATGALKLGAGDQVLPTLASLLARPQVSESVRLQIVNLLATLPGDASRQTLLDALAQAPAPLQRAIAVALCGNPAGAAGLVEAIRKGKASARVLQDGQVAQRFKQQAPPELQQQAAALLKGLPSIEQRLIRLIAQRRASYRPGQSSAARGKQVFTKHCAICHKVGNEGKLIGPQLDGVGLRGIDRLLEDILDPNRNVDVSFRAMTVVTDEGKIFSGLRRRQQGKLLVIADQQGKEIEIPTDEIDEILPSRLSPMPANLATTLQPTELHDLLTYLLSLQTKNEP